MPCYVYILEIRDRGHSKKLYFTDTTNNIQKRYRQHLFHTERSKYLKTFHRRAEKKLAYVESLPETERVMKGKREAIKRRRTIRKMSRIAKRVLIHSNSNILESMYPEYGFAKVKLK